MVGTWNSSGTEQATITFNRDKSFSLNLSDYLSGTYPMCGYYQIFAVNFEHDPYTSYAQLYFAPNSDSPNSEQREAGTIIGPTEIRITVNSKHEMAIEGDLGRFVLTRQ